MAKPQKDWAVRWRVRLMHILGGQCRQCGSTNNLEFDCIESRGDRHHKMDTSARMSFYRREYREFNLQILCQSCNARKADKEAVCPF